MAHPIPILRRQRALRRRTHLPPDPAILPGGLPHLPPLPENGPPTNLWDGQGTPATHILHHVTFDPVGAQAMIVHHDGQARVVWATAPRPPAGGHTDGTTTPPTTPSAGAPPAPPPASPRATRVDVLRAKAMQRLFHTPATNVGLSAAFAAAASCCAALMWAGGAAGLPFWATAIGASIAAVLAGLATWPTATTFWTRMQRGRMEPAALVLAQRLDAGVLDAASWRALGPVLRAQQDWAHPASGDHDGTEGDGVWHIEAAWRPRSHGLEMTDAHLVPWRWQRTPPHKRLKLWAYLSRKTLHTLEHPLPTTGGAVLDPPSLFPCLAPQDAESLWAQGWEAMGGWTWKTAPFPTATAHQRLALLRACLPQDNEQGTGPSIDIGTDAGPKPVSPGTRAGGT